MEAPLLIVEDDAEIRELLSGFLGDEGFAVRAVADGAAMDAAMAEAPPRLVVLDVMLPGEDGFALCRRLRAIHPDLPILMLTAKVEDIDRIVGLEIGADDYVTKPFSPRVLLARIRALLRRAERNGASPEDGAQRIGPLLLEREARRLSGPGGEIALSGAEFALLVTLADAPGRVLSRDTLLDRVFGRDATPYDRSIDVLVSRLRKKIEADPARPALVKTVRGGGYVLARP